MSSVFTLEQQILSCWHITDDITVLLNQLDKRKMNDDEILNYLIGLSTIYNQKFEQLFDTFEDMVYNKAFKNEQG